jgi:hypothetical protein
MEEKWRAAQNQRERGGHETARVHNALRGTQGVKGNWLAALLIQKALMSMLFLFALIALSLVWSAGQRLNTCGSDNGMQRISTNGHPE